MSLQTPWLTVVTVVKDDVDGLARTAASLVAQAEAGDWEWLVIDSSSDDQSVTELIAHTSLPTPSTARCEWREPRGVYAAMNEALNIATGTFVLFLNAGDWLIDEDVLHRVHAIITETEPSWLFGPVDIIQVDGQRVRTPAWSIDAERRACFARGHFPPHQGTLARRLDLIAAGGFDPAYPIAADYAMFLSLINHADPIQVAFPIAVFVEGGLSTQRWRDSFREFHRARRAILAPRGFTALRERAETVRHYAAVSAYRALRSMRPRHRRDDR